MIILSFLRLLHVDPIVIHFLNILLHWSSDAAKPVIRELAYRDF